jgi:5-formyltetrahydrofolate cyclo-ligase
MNVQIFDRKNSIRKKSRQMREALGEDVRSIANTAIQQQIENWIVFQHSLVVLAYLPIKAEVDLRPLIEKYPNKRWALPRILPGRDRLMQFHPFDRTRLVRHKFGMEEPDADLPVILPGEIELALVPGLAFDRMGWRLGYGGGYFDRFLKDFHGISLGITFKELLFESLPHDSNDMRMNCVATENELFTAVL